MGANLLLFKTVIAGDSWGTIAVPVIENLVEGKIRQVDVRVMGVGFAVA